MTKIPPYLKKNDLIGLVAPAGFMPEEKFKQAMHTLREWGFKLLMGKTPGHQFHYFSGTDEERRDDLQAMLDNPEVKAIFCVRGGYGVGKIIEQLDFRKFKKHPKWIIGFSDITVLHSHIFTNFHIATMHAPMAAAFNDGKWQDKYVQSLRTALAGKKTNYLTESHALNNPGKAKGGVVGGNLVLLTHLIGSTSEIQTKNKILFVEDDGEYIYNVDRMMTQLKRSGKLDNLRGLIVGTFNDTKDTTIPFGMSLYEAIHELVKEYDYPICFNFPIGHTDDNYTVKIGVEYELDVGKKNVRLREI